MTENRQTDMIETIWRFFSFFTILTNLLVALYFTGQSLKPTKDRTLFYNPPGLLTAITVYITIVGLVYQLLLRHLWQPAGIQWVVDELLHSVIPLVVIIYWLLYENKSQVRYRQVSAWLIYPLLYLLCILTRGRFSDFYPYPFVNVKKLGLERVLVNSILLTVSFAVVSLLLVCIGKRVSKRPSPQDLPAH